MSKDHNYHDLNLGGGRQLGWHKEIKHRLFLMPLFLTILIALVWGIVSATRQLKTQNQQLQRDSGAISQKINDVKAKTARLQQTNLVVPPVLSPDMLETWLQRIEKLPLKHGGVEMVQLNNRNGFLLKINGKLANQAEFEQMNQYFQQWKNPLRIEHFQVVEQQKVAFSLSIGNIGDIGDEK